MKVVWGRGPKGRWDDEKITAIVVSYKTPRLLCESVRELATKTLSPLQIIAMELEEKSREAEGEVRRYGAEYVFVPGNPGYAGALNIGLERADPDSRFMLFQNADAWPKGRGWDEEAKRILKGDLALVALDMTQPPTTITKVGPKRLGGREGWTVIACGAALLWDRSKMEPLWDEEFWPGYFEDTELSIRARKEGWRFSTRLLFEHMGMASFTPEERRRAWDRNLRLLLRKHPEVEEWGEDLEWWKAMERPQVSVVCVSKGRKTLEEAMKSVEGQTFGDFEVVVIGPEVRGIPQARNEGIRRARGILVAWIDDDELWRPERLEYSILPFLETANCGLAWVDTEYVREGEEEGKFWGAWCREGGFNNLDLMAGNWIPAGAATVRREAITREGGFDENLEILEDWDMWLRIGRRWRIAHVCTRDEGRGLLIYRRLGDSATSGLRVREWHDRIGAKWKSKRGGGRNGGEGGSGSGGKEEAKRESA